MGGAGMKRMGGAGMKKSICMTGLASLLLFALVACEDEAVVEQSAALAESAQPAKTLDVAHVQSKSVKEGSGYSPYAGNDFPESPLWGDSHLHTSLSIDAGLFGNRLPPREAYRFARGEEVVSSSGQAAQLSRPLDWLVIADHSDGMGLVADLISGKPETLAFEQAARWSKGIQQGGQAAVDAALDLITTFSQAKIDPALLKD